MTFGEKPKVPLPTVTVWTAAAEDVVVAAGAAAAEEVLDEDPPPPPPYCARVNGRSGRRRGSVENCMASLELSGLEFGGID